MMRPLQLDFAAQPGPLRKLGIVLLVAGMVVALWVGRSYQSASEELARRNASWEALQSQRSVAAPPSRDGWKQFDTELGAANQTVGRLSLPWDRLFLEVETSVDEHVTLLGLEPDADKGELKIEAEARNLDAMLAYAKRMRASPFFKGAYLQSHQMQLQEPQRPVRFTVNARWLLVPAPSESAPGAP